MKLKQSRYRGLPENAQISNLSWSPDETKVAFTNTTGTGVELWYFDFETGMATRLTEANLNANMGNPYTWFRDGSAFLVRILPEDKPALIDAAQAIPTGPTVSVSEQGQKAQNRTYQDLLQNATDEANFETLITSELYKVDLSGNKLLWKSKDLYAGESFSPDGSYVLIRTIHRPYSYIVPYYRFPVETSVYDINGTLVSKFDDKPLEEVLPKGFMATSPGKRNISWRFDRPATLYWVEALDKGDPDVKVDFRDEIFEVSAPFTGQPLSLAKIINRFNGVAWGGSETTAILYDNWWNTRNTKVYLFDPSNPQQSPVILSDRNYQDVYSDPGGSFDMKRNEYGRYILNIDGDKAYLIGEGFTEKGQFPFVDEVDLKTKVTKRLYQSGYTDKNWR